MKEYRETEKLLLYKKVIGSKTIFYRKHKKNDTEPVQTHEISGDKITCLYNSDKIKEVIFEGFTELPSFYSDAGYGFRENVLNRFFAYKLDLPNGKIIISQNKKSKKSRNTLTVNLDDLENLLKSINQEQSACNATKSMLVTNFISQLFPDLPFDFRETNSNKNFVLRNLNHKLLEQITAEDVEKIGKFYVEATKKYKRPDYVRRMMTDIQKNAQLITLQEIIKQYKELIKKDPPEKEWQAFFNEYITLFDNRYVQKINYKNIATGLNKYPDLVLVDIYGYIDFYELKKSGTKLIEQDRSHNTFYWSKEISMAIAQASDYLQKSKENNLSYAKTIKEETAVDNNEGLSINIINPRAIIVAGTSEQLNTDKKRNQFKNLRESLKDIEFVLYDELLLRMENLFSKIKTQ